MNAPRKRRAVPTYQYPLSGGHVISHVIGHADGEIIRGMVVFIGMDSTPVRSE